MMSRHATPGRRRRWGAGGGRLSRRRRQSRGRKPKQPRAFATGWQVRVIDNASLFFPFKHDDNYPLAPFISRFLSMNLGEPFDESKTQP